jgi:hypothetical protein
MRIRVQRGVWVVPTRLVKTSVIVSRLESVRQNPERAQSPSCRQPENQNERAPNYVIRVSSFAPALEHANHSNREKEDRAERERFDKHRSRSHLESVKDRLAPNGCQ